MLLGSVGLEFPDEQKKPFGQYMYLSAILADSGQENPSEQGKQVELSGFTSVVFEK